MESMKSILLVMQSDKEKFLKWAETVPNTIGNALYHWTHLELKRYFGIEELLNKDTAEDIWNRCNELLAQEDFSCQNLIKRSNVKVICTTDDPVDDLHFHEQIKNQADFDVKVLPTFRPDKGLEINKQPFVGFVNQLEQVTNKKFAIFKDYLPALEERVQFFHEVGCRVSDHGLGEVPFATYEESELDAIFQSGRNGDTVSIEDENEIQNSYLWYSLRVATNKEVGQCNFTLGQFVTIIQRLFEKLGPDAGLDSIGDIGEVAKPLNGLLNAMEVNDSLPRTIVYNLNPAINDLIGSTIENFQTEAGIKGKIQFGSGWWFNDTKPGMIRQMTALMDQGLIMHFVGMLTDSRSFISYCRHEYFRRILCDLVGTWVEDGEIPNDPALLQRLIREYLL